ncbi:MAG: TolC family protein, partial [Myxococcota bacterium]
MRYFLTLALALSASAASAQTLELADVLASTQTHHPQIEAALQSEEAAREQLLASRGGFDPYLSVYGSLRHGGYYELRGIDAEIRQATPYWGAEVYAGYRYHEGVDQDRFPTYYSTETLNGGEVRAGLRVPILRGGPMDSRRARVARSEFSLEGAENARQLTLLEVERSALTAYFSWVASGRRLQVAEQL